MLRSPVKMDLSSKLCFARYFRFAGVLHLSMLCFPLSHGCRTGTECRFWSVGHARTCGRRWTYSLVQSNARSVCTATTYWICMLVGSSFHIHVRSGRSTVERAVVMSPVMTLRSREYQSAVHYDSVVPFDGVLSEPSKIVQASPFQLAVRYGGMKCRGCTAVPAIPEQPLAASGTL